MNDEAIRDARRNAAIERLKSRNLSRRRGEKEVRFQHAPNEHRPLMKNVVEVKMVKGKAVYDIQRHDYYKDRN